MVDYDVIIIGGGAAGLAAALYSTRFSLKTLVVAKEFGGTGNIAHKVDNWIGEPGISGMELMQKFIKHIETYKVPFVTATVKEVKKDKKGFVVVTDGKKYIGKTIIFANGMVHRELNVKGEEEFKNKGVHYCYTCLTPDTNIMTNPDVKNIKDVGNDKILTHKGEFKKYHKKIDVPYEGDILSITPRFLGGKTKLTPSHRILGIKRTWKNFKSINERKKLKPEWIEAGELKKGDYITYPIIKKTKDIEFLDLGKILKNKKIEGNFIMEKNQRHTSKRIPIKLKLNEDLLSLFGYYVAEGTNGHNGIIFDFNKNETEYIDHVSNLINKIFGLEAKKDFRESTTRVYVNSKILRDLFEEFFGHYAHEKKIPQGFIYLPKEKQGHLIKTMWRGDGCTREKDFCYVTSSKKLTNQLKLMLMRFGIIPRIEVRKKEKLKSSFINGREIKFNHDKHHIYISGPYLKIGEEILDIKHSRINNRNREMHYGWLDKNYAYLPIREIRNEFYSGKVYDLAVKGENSYTTENMIVHNCDGPLYGGKTVAVVGGSDSAGLGALMLKDYAKKVYVIYRGDKLRAEPITTKQIYADKKIEVIHKSNVKEFYGDKILKGVKLDTGKDVKLDGVFIEIGHIPLTDIAKKLGIKLNEGKFIKVSKGQETSIDGVFAAGDMTDATTLKQFITSAAEGSISAQSAYFYLSGKKKTKGVFR